MVTLSSMTARLAHLEARSRPEPPVRFVILTGDDKGVPGPDDEGESTFRFTIHLDRPGSTCTEEEADA